MTVIATDQLQLGIVEEVVTGTTPATPAFDLIRTTGESLTFTPNSSESAELAGSESRCAKPGTVTGQSVAGDINFELAPAPWLDVAFEGVLAAAWGECPLDGSASGAFANGDRISVGNELRTYTIEKRFPDPQNPGQYLYQWYRGCSLSVINISVAPNETVTGTLSIVGGVPELGSAMIAGATYASAGNGAVFTAPQVSELTVGNMLDIGTNCWTSATINLDSQNRGVPCIGSVGDREVVLGSLRGSVEGEVYFNDQAVLQAVLDNQVIGDTTITLENADGAILRFDFFEMKPSTAQLVTPGTNQDLTIPLTLEPGGAKVCDDGTNTWWSCVMISKDASAPTVTKRITARAGDIMGDESIVTVGGGPSDGAYNMTIIYAVDGGNDQTAPVVISADDTVSDVLTSMATAVGTATGIAVSAQDATTITIGLDGGTSLDRLAVSIEAA